MYDLIIIGAGPAGMTAAIYAVRREMKTLVIGKEIGGQVSLASEIENYPGFKNIKSFELIQRMKEQAIHFGAEFKQDEVEKIEKDGDTFIIHTGGDKFSARTIVIAMGLSPRRLVVPGEVELAGHGVSYCANCDGPFFRDKVVAIIGGGNSALDAAEVMSKIAKKVYLVHRRDSFRAFESLVNEVKSKENIEIVYDSSPKSIEGDGKVERLVVSDVNTEKERIIELDGVFIEIGHIASTDIVADLVERNDHNEIIINCNCETKTSGVFAAGDVTNVDFKQISIAVGQATIAALSAYKYLQTKQSK